MTERTPGRWHYDGLAIYSRGRPGGDLKVASIECTIDFEAAHNGHFIAAAPDMEKALEEAESALAIAASYVNVEQKRMQSSLESIRDALAKAKGTA